MNEYYDIFNSKSPSALTKIPGVQTLLEISEAPAIKLAISRILALPWASGNSATRAARALGRLTDLRYEHLLGVFFTNGYNHRGARYDAGKLLNSHFTKWMPPGSNPSRKKMLRKSVFTGG